MTASSPTPNDHSWLTKLSTDSQETEAYYDAWAENYDDTLAQWNYQSPTIVATMLKQEVPPDGHVLDAGCGTGLSGKALHAAGFRRITGIDISQASLDVAAQAGVCERLIQVNMQQVPLPLETGTSPRARSGPPTRRSCRQEPRRRTRRIPCRGRGADPNGGCRAPGGLHRSRR